MLFSQKTSLAFYSMVNTLFITKPILLLEGTKVICQEIDEICIMSYKEAKFKKTKVIARLWFSCESGNPLKSHDDCDGHHPKYYHSTLPLFKRIAYNSSRIGPTFNRLGEKENILQKFIK